MLTDKEIKKTYKAQFSKSPEKYYATSVLEGERFKRKKCPACGLFFWSIASETCGNPECSGGFRFIGKSPAKEKLGYIEVWKKFSSLFKARGYTPIPRYPVVARWRTDTDFVQASIYDFQPYVVKGEVAPPANPLVIPQFCLRFNDIDNIGFTGAHYTGFVMIGQHAFMPPDEFDQQTYFADIHHWLRKGLGLPNEEIIYHEDVWAGGGNFGPCMEFFSRGLELGNQVYMLYEKTDTGHKELAIKVLDMGMGHERNAWFTNAAATSYETTFPTAIRELYAKTGIKTDKALVQQFLPYAAYLNIDEVDDIDKVWRDIAKKLNHDVAEIKGKIIPLASLYAVAEHTRSLLFAFNDGALPSNVGGGYNLRVILRRALDMVERYQWNVDFHKLFELHASYLKPLYPELGENLDDVKKIFDVERAKYKATRQKTQQLMQSLMKKKVTDAELLKVYDSHGVSPELLAEEAKKSGSMITIPENFYARVTEIHEKKEQKHATKKEFELDLRDVKPTEALYFKDTKLTENQAKVVKIIGNHVILDKTVAYPTSGGQLHDIGAINGQEFIDVFKQNTVIVHTLREKPRLKVGETITVKIDYDRRLQLGQHHTATHIINAAARRVLGNHANQASAFKDVHKARIDITHYESLSPEQLQKIEEEANKIISQKIKIVKSFMSRQDAEKTFGMSIYQGGVPIGKDLRIVNIVNTDVECCGGTHLDNTSDVEKIKILGSSKISDSIVRIEFVAGKKVKEELLKESLLLQEVIKVLGVKKEFVPSYAEEIFTRWKTIVKKKKDMPVTFSSTQEEMKRAEKRKDAVKNKSDKDILEMTAKILKTQPEHVPKTLKRFLEEIIKEKEQ